MKDSLGTLGALGLGGLALSGCARQPKEAPGRPWRDEKVFILFYPPDKKKREKEGRWVVDPGHKPVTPGQAVTWKVLGAVEKATLNLPTEVFLTTSLTITRGNNTATSRVKADAPEGFYPYQVSVDGQAAEGGSHPGVIVDGGG